MHLRHLRERTRSVLGGIPTQSVGTIIIVFLQEDLCITMSEERGNDQPWRWAGDIKHAHKENPAEARFSRLFP